jgi:hypothetical protein
MHGRGLATRCPCSGLSDSRKLSGYAEAQAGTTLSILATPRLNWIPFFSQLPAERRRTKNSFLAESLPRRFLRAVTTRHRKIESVTSKDLHSPGPLTEIRYGTLDGRSKQREVSRRTRRRTPGGPDENKSVSASSGFNPRLSKSGRCALSSRLPGVLGPRQRMNVSEGVF